MNPVMTLAERVCPDCSAGFHSNPFGGVGGGPCPTCNGTGALVPGLRKGCSGKWFADHLKNKYPPCCQGRGWVLIPQAEQMGVLLALIKVNTVYRVNHHNWGFRITPDITYQAVMDDRPNEALAEVILVALGD